MRHFYCWSQNACIYSTRRAGIIGKLFAMASADLVKKPYNHGRFMSSPPPKFPSASNETVAEKFYTPKKTSACIKLDPRAVFPWRHSSHPLPRLVPNTEEFLSEGGYLGPNLPPLNIFFRSAVWISACEFLGGRLMNYWQWKHELEYAFQHAFTVGVDRVLNDIYHPNTDDADPSMENTVLDDKENSLTIDFDHLVKPDDDYQLKQAKEEEAGSEMIEPSLISLYRSAHTFGKHKLQIKLKSRPKSAEIMSLFIVPFLTRREVKDNISLKHSFRNIVKAMHEKEQKEGRGLSYWEVMNIAGEMVGNMWEKQLQRMGGNTAQVTIIAQVSVQCDELFVVRDIETGDVVQGDPDGNINDVTHLVRFEMVVDIKRNQAPVLGSWQITDWDDLIDGNIWFY